MRLLAALARAAVPHPQSVRLLAALARAAVPHPQSVRLLAALARAAVPHSRVPVRLLAALALAAACAPAPAGVSDLDAGVSGDAGVPDGGVPSPSADGGLAWEPGGVGPGAPAFARLHPLPGGGVGPMVVTSNNPEAFTDVGVLYGTARASAVRGGERFPLSGDFGVYLHHLNATSGARYVGVVVTNPGAVAVTVEAHGAGWSQDDTGGVGLGTSPDYRVSEAWLADARPVSVPPSSLAPLRPLALYTAALAHGHEVDARLAVHASGPVYVYVIASATGSLDEAIQRSRTDAPGNIDVPGTPPPPYGREAGVYSHDTWRATIPLLVPAAGHRVGFQLDTAAGTKGAVQDQAFAALTRYADSAPEAVGMYGDVFDVAFDLAHDGNDASDRRVRLWAVSYAGGAGSRLWDGAASVDGVPAALRLTPAAPRQLLADVRLADGAHRRLTFEAMVPGLASIPAALVLESY